jgi:PAS domain S-box-containing protein
LRFGIRVRLLSAFAAIALFTGVLGWYAVSTMEHLNDGQRTVFVDVFGGTHLLATWVDTSWQAQVDLLNALLTDGSTPNPATLARLSALDAQLDSLAHQMDEADTDREDVGTLAGLTQAWNTYAAWRDEAVLGPLERGDREAALAAYIKDGPRLAEDVDQRIDAYLGKKHTVGAMLEAQADASFDQTRFIAILLSIVAAGLGLGIGFVLSRNIARGVGEVATAAKGLATGDLNQNVPVRSKDEIGQMAAAVREMIAYQQEMARVADAIARGDLNQSVHPKAATDRLGVAFQHMIENLRTLVGQLEDAVRRANQLAELAEGREAKFRGLLESAPDAIVTVNRDGKIALVNTQAELLFGYNRSDLLGENITTLLPEDARTASVRHRAGLVDSRTTGSASGGALELTARHKDGSEFPVEISLSPLESEEGILTTSVIRDITERKQAERDQLFLTEASNLLAVSLDYQTTLASVARLAVPFLADGCVVEVLEDDDDVAPTLSAVAVVEPAGTRLNGILGSLPAQVLQTGLPYVCSTEHPDSVPAITISKLRQAGFTAVMLVPLVAAGRPLGVISFVATRQVPEYGSKRLNLAQELAHRCALAIENARLYREAQSAIGLRDDFFSTASHELKTPVAALLAYTQFMLKRAERQGGLNPEQIEEALDEIHWQSDRIARLVAQLLDTSRLDADKLALEPQLTDVAALVDGAALAARTTSPRHTLTVRATTDSWAMIDPVRFEQVVTNLIDNAVKYSPGGGIIDIELSRRDAMTMQLVVRDHGIGVPPQHRAHVFDRFYQAHPGQHFAGVAGMGLGLYISRRIVELHGGVIHLETPPDGGAEVTVTFPTRVAEIRGSTDAVSHASA